MPRKLQPIENKKEKKFVNLSCQPNSLEIDYTNNGWDKINIEETIFKLFKNAGISKEISDYSELNGGFFNKVILIETSSGKYVLKISPLWNKGGLARENFVYSNLQNKSHELFKMARIYSYTPSNNAIVPNHEALIIEYISGSKPMAADLDIRKFHKKISSFLSTIHSIPMKGYGWLNENFAGKKNSWQDFLVDIDNLNVTKNSNLLTEKELTWLINKLVNKCNDDFNPVLLYGDLKPENILIKNDDIYLIDFENCFSGHKYYDIGIGLFFIPKIQKYLNTYLKENEQKKIKKQIILYAMRHAISCLGHRINIGNTNELNAAIERFFELKKLYESEKN